MNVIVIVAYYTDFFIKHQLNRIRSLCEDDIDIFVVDNTPENRKEVSKNILETCKKYDAAYGYLGINHACGSYSHCTALNEAFTQLSTRGYKRFVTLDQDLIPFKKFKTNSDYILKGLKQERAEHVYMEPIYSSFDLNEIKNIDFMPGYINGTFLDGGAHFHPYIKALPEEKVYFIKQEHKHAGTNRFHEILDEKMFHFIRGSNWGTPESPSLTEEENAQKIKNLSEEYNKLSEDYKI